MDALKQGLMLGGARVVATLLPKADEAEAPRASVHHRRAGYSQEEINAAFGRLMTGPKATQPRWKTLRRTILIMRNGIKAIGSGRNVSYRRAKCKPN